MARLSSGRFARLGFALVLSASCSALAHGVPPHEVKVERVKPEKKTTHTLRFLRANLDFLRSQFDYLEEREQLGARRADGLDSTALQLEGLLAEARATRERSAPADDSGMRANLEALLAAESSLDGVEAELNAQSSRLAAIESLYLEAPPTALLIVAKGHPDAASLRLIDDAGISREILLPTSELPGELAELSYERIEPRRQVLSCAIAGSDSLYLTIDPAIGAVSVLELDFDRPANDDPFTARIWSVE
ncbi:MAG: hypothetical protein U0527_08860 [Candidatus Eisenbacteria bacterium]